MSTARAFISLAFFLTCVSQPARADEPAERAFVRQVVTRNPSLHARALTRQSLRTRAAAEGYWPDPQVSVMLDRVPERHDGEMPMLRYQLNQMVMWPGKLGLMEAAAEQKAEVAAALEDVRRLELTREAQRAYLMLAQNRGYRDVNLAAQRVLETVARSAIARFGAGTGNHHEVVRTEVERSTLDLEAAALEGQRLSIVAMLNALRDLPTGTPIPDPSPPSATAVVIERLKLDELLRLATSRRPELKQMRAMAREEAAMAALAKRERYPDLMGGIWYNQMLGGPDTAGVMVGASLPVFGASRQEHRAEAAALAARSARSEASSMEAMIRFQVTDALQRARTAERTLQLVKTVAQPRAEQSFGSALSAYATGGSDMVFVLDAWRALQRLDLARIDAIVAARMAVVDLQWATGGSLPEGSP